MKIAISKIRELRKETQAPVMECKRALAECGGEMKKAKLFLKKRGLVRAKKKKGRKTNEGLVHSYLHANNKIGVLAKICCETDFVARNPEFEKLAHEISMQICAMAPKDVKQLLSQEYIRDSKKTIQNLIDEAIAKFGENIEIKEFIRLEI